MEVRLATIKDIDALFVLNELFENTTTKEAMQNTIQENDREIICIAYVKGIAAGYCTGLIVKSMCYRQQRIDIETLYVRNEYRNQGIGQALIHCLERTAAAAGIYHFHINTHQVNIAAQTLYRRMGYAPTGEILLDKTIR
ncbi:MAG: GNAT family N-acetyltransferase [Clostridiales bacterium]